MFRRSNSVVSASGGEAEKLLDMGSRVLEAAKRMCQSAFIEFDLGLMHTGLTLGLIHASLLLVLAAVLGTKAQVQSLKRAIFPVSIKTIWRAGSFYKCYTDWLGLKRPRII